MRWIAVLLLLSLTSCAGGRAIGNKETEIWEPKEGQYIERDGVLYKKTIISMKSDAHAVIEIKPDGTKIYDSDNNGLPGPFHDAAKLVETLVIKDVIDDGD